jgi:hypothetical protein
VTEVNHYQLKQSRALFGFLLGLYLTLFLLVAIYFTGWLQFGLILLVLAHLYFEINRYKSSSIYGQTVLTLNSRTSEITINQNRLDKNFREFRLYSNRWFLILQLRQAHSSKSILIISDRFNSMTEYLSFRHQINRMDQRLDVD